MNMENLLFQLLLSYNYQYVIDDFYIVDKYS